MAAGIVSVEEGLTGFANEGLLTVVVLFVVAAGISRTGGLDWYMGKLLGSPRTLASAQLRLMVPIAVVSAFLNNTPVVSVMIPIVQRWGENNGINPGQLMIPLSFASILGGTCTLIGTSTNLVVKGMLAERYGAGRYDLGLFSLGLYGVPVALSGLAYILVLAPLLLPGGRRGPTAGAGGAASGPLVGARVLSWSRVAGHTVGESGLRDRPGLYLVSVQRPGPHGEGKELGVDPELVLGEGDVVWFTGLVESLGDVCEEHGLQAVTAGDSYPGSLSLGSGLGSAEMASTAALSPHQLQLGAPGGEGDEHGGPGAQRGNGILPRLSAALRGHPPASQEAQRSTDELVLAELQEMLRSADVAEIAAAERGEGHVEEEPNRVVVAPEKAQPDRFFMLGIDTEDRVGLLHDISKGLSRLRVSISRSEVSVIGRRSISVWRCELLTPAAAHGGGGGGAESTAVQLTQEKLDQVVTVMHALLENTTGVRALKQRGLAVLRATVNEHSRLVGRIVAEVHFRTVYRAAIVAIQRDGHPVPPGLLSGMRLWAGDVLVLQVEDDSPLLQPPPIEETRRRSMSVRKLLSSKRWFSDTNSECSDSTAATSADEENPNPVVTMPDPPTNSTELLRTAREAWVDFTVHSRFNKLGVVEEGSSVIAPDREFLTAMRVKERSVFIGKTITASGLRNVPGLFLVSHERAGSSVDSDVDMSPAVKADGARSPRTPPGTRTPGATPKTCMPEETLGPGDVLWFAGSASAVGDLRKVPGLEPFEEEQVKKVAAPLHERRLVQVVVARSGPLVGRRIKDVRFRTRFSAAVVAVHREGSRVHARVGDVVLQAGDVLLLEAGPAFLTHTPSPEIHQSFALIAPLEDSAPPRLRLLVPSLLCAVTMISVYTAGACSLLVAAVSAAAVMMACGCLSQQEARSAVKWDVYVTIAAAFGISKALAKSGLAGTCAELLVRAGSAANMGDAGLYVAVYLATFLISNVVTNNAAAALIFPIATNAAEQTGIDILSMSFLVMLAASASFMSPFGYQTNLMVYGPGGYKFKDFLLFGFPMQLVQMVVSVMVLGLDIGGVWVWWIIVSGGFLLVSVSRVFGIAALCGKLRGRAERTQG